MFRYFSRLREKPVGVRRRIAITLTIVAVLFVAAAWFILANIRSTLLDAPKSDAPSRETNGIVAPY